MEGARWDTQTSLIQESRLKELTPSMPVIFIKAIPVDKQDSKNVYECPVYKTRMRGPTYVWTFNLKTKEKPAKGNLEPTRGLRLEQEMKWKHATVHHVYER
jgi:dynein heavy chain